MKDPIFDVFAKYKSFEIKKVDNNTVILESQIIPYGSKKGHKMRVMFDFEKVTDFEFKEEMNGDTMISFNIDNAKYEFIEVDRTK